jgi:hypothetical protein
LRELTKVCRAPIVIVSLPYVARNRQIDANLGISISFVIDDDDVSMSMFNNFEYSDREPFDFNLLIDDNSDNDEEVVKGDWVIHRMNKPVVRNSIARCFQ